MKSIHTNRKHVLNAFRCHAHGSGTVAKPCNTHIHTVHLCGQTLFPIRNLAQTHRQTHTESHIEQWVSQTLPVSHTNKHSASRGEVSDGAPARLYGGTDCSELLHSAATLHGSAIQSP